MIKLTKAHAYGNDFLYIEKSAAGARPLEALARLLCDRHLGIGADGLIVYERTPDGAAMRLYNADGGRAEVSGNGVRALGALLLRDDERPGAPETPESNVAGVTILTEAGPKVLARVSRIGSRQTFRAAMGLPAGLREELIVVDRESLRAVVLNMGNPHCVLIGPLPDDDRFHRVGAVIERHPFFPNGTNVEFAQIENPGRIRVRIWERGVGPTTSSGTGACAALVASAAFGGAARDAEVVSPGGGQRVEWCDGTVYLTGWAEVLFDAEWLG